MFTCQVQSIFGYDLMTFKQRGLILWQHDKEPSITTTNLNVTQQSPEAGEESTGVTTQQTNIPITILSCLMRSKSIVSSLPVNITSKSQKEKVSHYYETTERCFLSAKYIIIMKNSLILMRQYIFDYLYMYYMYMYFRNIKMEVHVHFFQDKIFLFSNSMILLNNPNSLSWTLCIHKVNSHPTKIDILRNII